MKRKAKQDKIFSKIRLSNFTFPFGKKNIFTFIKNNLLFHKIIPHKENFPILRINSMAS